MDKKTFVSEALRVAKKHGLPVHTNRNGQEQICFNVKSKKSLHSGHLEQLHPRILNRRLTKTEINALIEEVAPGRPCTHRGMRAIVQDIQKRS